MNWLTLLCVPRSEISILELIQVLLLPYVSVSLFTCVTEDVLVNGKLFCSEFYKTEAWKKCVWKWLHKDIRVLTVSGTMNYYRNVMLLVSLNGFLARVSIAFCTQDVPMHKINTMICELFINMGHIGPDPVQEPSHSRHSPVCNFYPYTLLVAAPLITLRTHNNRSL